MRRWGPLGLALVTAVVFWEAVTGRGIFFQRDIHSYWLPLTEAFVRVVLVEGAPPVWNPYPSFGQAMAADPNCQVFYPPTWLNMIVGPATYYSILVVSHTLFAGLGAYLLLRRLGLGELAGFVGGVAWCLSGPLLAGASLYHHFAGAAWMPWVLLALESALARGTLKSGILLGLAAGLQSLAGSADLCFMTALLAAGRGVAYLTRPADRGAPWRLAGVVAMALPLAAMVGAVQWLPARALLAGTTRASQGASVSLYWSLSPLSLLDFWVPRLVRELPLTDDARRALFEARDPFLWCLYLGIPASALAAWAVLAPGPRARWMLAAAFVGFAWMSLGRHGHLLTVLLNVPGFGLFRYPPKYLWPAALAWGLLAGLGMEAWARPWGALERRRAAWLAAGAALLAVVTLAGALILGRPGIQQRVLGPLAPPGQVSTGAGAAQRKLLGTAALLAVSCALFALRRRRETAPRWLTAALVACAVGDLVAAGRGVNDMAPPELLSRRPPLVDHILSSATPSRVYVAMPHISDLRDVVRGPGEWAMPPTWAYGYQDLLLPPTSGRWGILGSYDGDFTGLAAPAVDLLTKVLLDNTVGPRADLGHKLLRMGAVTHVVTLRPVVFGGLPEVAQHDSIFRLPVRLFRVPDPVPLVYVVGRARIADEPRSYLDIQDPSFDPAREVILPLGEPLAAAEAFRGEASVRGRGSDALQVDVDVSHRAYLVVTERYHRGWEARVDGAPAPVLRANVLFRAVPLPPGRHTVEMRYRAAGLRPGLVLTGLGLALALAGLAAGRLNATPGAPNMAPP
jgi:hypothetical protein